MKEQFRDFYETIDFARKNKVSIFYHTIAESVDEYISYKEQREVFEKSCKRVELAWAKQVGTHYSIALITRALMNITEKRMPGKYLTNEIVWDECEALLNG